MGCKKTDDQKPSDDDNYTDSYLPLKTGNSWTYIRNGNSKDTVIFTVDGTGFDQGYQHFYGVSGKGEEGNYYSSGNNLYTMMIYHDAGPGYADPILDTDEPEGYTITTYDTLAYSNDPTPPLSTMTILGTGFRKTINGKVYQNVIHTNVDVEEAFNDHYMSVQTYDFYFAQGIGLIEIDRRNAGQLYDTLTIIDYQIK